jgi:hypothetical protein
MRTDASSEKLGTLSLPSESDVKFDVLPFLLHKEEEVDDPLVTAGH